VDLAIIKTLSFTCICLFLYKAHAVDLAIIRTLSFTRIFSFLYKAHAVDLAIIRGCVCIGLADCKYACCWRVPCSLCIYIVRAISHRNYGMVGGPYPSDRQTVIAHSPGLAWTVAVRAQYWIRLLSERNTGYGCCQSAIRLLSERNTWTVAVRAQYWMSCVWSRLQPWSCLNGCCQSANWMSYIKPVTALVLLERLLSERNIGRVV